MFGRPLETAYFSKPVLKVALLAWPLVFPHPVSFDSFLRAPSLHS